MLSSIIVPEIIAIAFYGIISVSQFFYGVERNTQIVYYICL